MLLRTSLRSNYTQHGVNSAKYFLQGNKRILVIISEGLGLGRGRGQSCMSRNSGAVRENAGIWFDFKDAGSNEI